jgi:dihydroxyacid dehydratase/phosphogluconate dehydratase
MQLLPGVGACGGMYTANTMASAMEAIGMSLPGSASIPAVDRAKAEHMRESARALAHLIEKDIVPRDIMTRKAFEKRHPDGDGFGGEHQLGASPDRPGPGSRGSIEHRGV